MKHIPYELHKEYYIRSSREQAIYDRDPNWRVGRSVLMRKELVNRCSLYFNHKHIAWFVDDFSIWDRIEQFIETEGYTHPKVIVERVRLGLLDPEDVTDTKAQEKLIAEKLVSMEQAEKYHEHIQREKVSSCRRKVEATKVITVEYADPYKTTDTDKSNITDESDSCFDPYNPTQTCLDTTETVDIPQKETYYKIGSTWIDSNGEILDYRVPCKSIWDMRKMVATQKATIEDAYLYTPGTCFQVLGDIAQRVVKNQVIDGLYKLSQSYKAPKYDEELSKERTLADIYAQCVQRLKTYMESITPSYIYYQFKHTVTEFQQYEAELFADETTASLLKADNFMPHDVFFEACMSLGKTNETYEAFKQLYDWFVAMHDYHTQNIRNYTQAGVSTNKMTAYYTNLYKDVQHSSALLQQVLMSTDPVIVEALTLPYVTGEPLVDAENVKVQTYAEFIYEIQMRLYTLLSSTPKLLGFRKEIGNDNTYVPVYSHTQYKSKESANSFMQTVYKIMTYQMSGHEAYLTNLGRSSASIHREHSRFMHDHMHQFIPYYAEKRKVFATIKSFEHLVLYIAKNIQDLVEMGLRESMVTAFDYEGMRYQLNCETLDMRGFMLACHLTPAELYQLGSLYQDGAISYSNLLKRCKDENLVAQLITEQKKDNLLFKVKRAFNWFRRQRSEKITEKYGKQWSSAAREEYYETEDTDWKRALNKHLYISIGSNYERQLSEQAEQKIQKFHEWWASVCKKNNVVRVA